MKDFSRVSDLERQYVGEVLDGAFSSSNTYKMVTRLEQAFAEAFHVKHAVAMVNGTATLHMALEAAGIGPGDEVICPPLTMSSTSLAVLHANAIPVFADVNPQTFLLDASSLEQAVTPRTKAVIPVSLYGLMPDMDAIMRVAGKCGLCVIEDNAQCFLPYSLSQKPQLGHMASYSFQSSKHITCGEGGIVTTDDDDFALKLRRYSGLGYAGISAGKGRITRDDIQHPDYARHAIMGFNYRMSDLCGAVALAQLERLDTFLEARILAANHYLRALGDCPWLRTQACAEDQPHAYWTFPLVLEHPEVSWTDFRKKYLELGGDRYYAAWRLSYLEPAFQDKNFLRRELIGGQYDNVEYRGGLCPQAEYLQPRLIQLKTNYFSESDMVRQADILRKTVAYFD